MATLAAFGFEGGVVPPLVTVTSGTMAPAIGRRVSDRPSAWGLSGSFTANDQPVVTIDTTTSNTKIGGAFFFRADNLEFTAPAALVTWGDVTFKITSLTNLELIYGVTTVNFTIPSLSTGWHVFQFNINRLVTDNAIAYTLDSGALQQITPASQLGGTANSLVIRGTRGFPSLLDDVRVETSVIDGSCPSPIECRKSSMQAAFRNQWSQSGAPTGASTGLNIKGMTYAASTGLFYALNNVGGLYKINPETLASTLITTVNSAQGHCAITYHAALNRIYFLGNGNVSYMNLATEAVTDSAQTIYYTNATNASGAYYEAATGNAYIVTQANSGSSNSVAIHKINVSGTYSVVVSNGVYTPAAPLTRHFAVCFDSVTDSVIFPMFSSYVVGACTQAGVLSVSNADGTATVTDVVDAGGYWGGTGTFLVASNTAGQRLRTWSGGLVARYQTNTITNAGITSKGMVYHHALGLVLFPADGASGNLYKVDKSSTTEYVQATAALTASASLYLLNQVNPITGGLLYVYNNALSECHLLSDLNVSTLLVKDSKYIQSASNNAEMLLLPSAIANASQTMIKQNVMSKAMFGSGSITMAGGVKNTTLAPANYAQALDPLPLPEVLYDCDGAQVIGDVVNLGSGVSSSSLVTLGTYSQSGIFKGKKYGQSGSGTLANFTNPAKSVGTGDFTFFISGRGRAWSAVSVVILGSGTDLRIDGVDQTNIKLTVLGSTALTFAHPLEYHTMKIARTSGVLKLFVDSVERHSQAFSNSLTLADNISIMTNSDDSAHAFALIHSLAFWGTTYISDPNPIASLNRREVKVVKSS